MLRQATPHGRGLCGYVKWIQLFLPGGAVAQLGARLDGIEEVVGSNPIGSTKIDVIPLRFLFKRILIGAVAVVAVLYCGRALHW